MHVRVAVVVAALAACRGGGATAPPVNREATAAPTPPACVAAPGPSESVHLQPLRPGGELGATLPEGWNVVREEAMGPVRAIVLTWPGNALGLVIVRDEPRRCILGTWALAFGGLGVELTGWRMERDTDDGQIHIQMDYVATYNNPLGEDGAEERGMTELRSDGHVAEVVRTEGYADFE